MIVASLGKPALCSVTFRVLTVAVMLPGCTSQPPAAAPDIAATSAEPAQRQADVNEPEDSVALAEPQSTPSSDPQPIETASLPPSDASSAPIQVSESPAAPAESPEPQPNAPDQVARDENDGREYRTV